MSMRNKQLFEAPNLVKPLLIQLTSEYISLKKIPANDEQKIVLYYISLFYLHENDVYIQVNHFCDDSETTMYCLNQEMKNWEKIKQLPKCIIGDEKAGNIASVIPLDHMELDGPAEITGLPISKQKLERAYFRLVKEKDELMESIQAGIDELDCDNMEDVTHDGTEYLREDSHDFYALEEQLLLYERLEHKEEYFITLDTYLIKCIRGGETERVVKLIKKFDPENEITISQTAEDKQLNELFIGVSKSKILEDFIKPRVAMNNELDKLLFPK